MKKKIISSLLLVAAVVVTSSTVFSCKDYDDEYQVQQKILEAKNATLQDLIDALKADLSRLEVAQENCSTTCGDKFTNLQTAINSINSRLGDFASASSVSALQGEVAGLQGSVDGLNTSIVTLTQNYSTLSGDIATIQGNLEAAQQGYDSAIQLLQDAIANAETTINNYNTYIGAQGESLDSLKTVTAELGETISGIQQTILEVQAKADAAQQAAATAQATANSALANAATAQATADAAQQAADAAKAVADAAKDAAQQGILDAATAQATADAAQQAADAAKATADAATGAITTLQSVVNNKVDTETFESAVTLLDEKVAAALADAAKAQATADADSVKIETINNTLTEVNSTIREIITTLSGKADQADLDALAEKVAANETKIADIIDYQIPGLREEIATAEQAAKDYADALAETLGEEIAKKASQEDFDLLSITVGELQDIVNAAIPELQDKVEALQTAVDALDTRVKAIEDALDTFVTKEDLAKLITGITINATENPVVGYINIPVDVRSQLLATYYGYADLTTESRTFPTIRTSNAVFADRVFTEGDDEILGIEGGAFQITINDRQLLFNETAGNAGKVYLTVNPNTVDFTGQTVALVNSQDQAAPVRLEALKKSDKVLSFGYEMTRAANNGFYEAKATLPAGKVEAAKLKVDVAGLKEVAKEVQTFVKDRSVNRSSLANIAKTLYGEVSGLADAQALKASWTDSQGDHSVYSQYGIASAAVKPLSYSFFKDANYKTVPGYERAINFIDRVIGGIKIDIPNVEIDPMVAPHVQEIKLQELSDDMIAKFTIKMDTVVFRDDQKHGQTLDTWVDGDTVPVYDNEGNVIGQAEVGRKEGGVFVPEQVITIHYDLSKEIQQIYADLQQPVSDVRDNIQNMVNDLIADVNEIVKQVNKLDNVRTSIEDAKEKIRTELEKYLSKLNNLIVKGVNNANNALQPLLLVKTSTGFSIASATKNAPNRINAETVLVPTSYTGEVVAPAYKKFLAVTNVYSTDLTKSAQGGDAACKAALQAVNSQGDFLKVLPGSQQAFQFKGGKPNYIYEVAYAALDYSGRDTVRKYYVRVY